jgi:hypothetical protein
MGSARPPGPCSIRNMPWPSVGWQRRPVAKPGACAGWSRTGDDLARRARVASTPCSDWKAIGPRSRNDLSEVLSGRGDDAPGADDTWPVTGVAVANGVCDAVGRDDALNSDAIDAVALAALTQRGIGAWAVPGVVVTSRRDGSRRVTRPQAGGGCEPRGVLLLDAGPRHPSPSDREAMLPHHRLEQHREHDQEPRDNWATSPSRAAPDRVPNACKNGCDAPHAACCRSPPADR